LRVANKAEYMTVLKNVANSIFSTGGFIRKIENWGEKDLPCKAHTDHGNYTRAGHFMFSFDVPPASVKLIKDDCKRNLGIIKAY
ncbi:28S ribosomal protein S6, mitochondrial-like, partial [Ceratina calcarata]